MRHTYNTINYDWLFRPTGDPFVDAGGYALKEFSGIHPNLDILDIIMKATDVYVDRWGSKINPFFLNSKITQPAFKPEKKKEETRKYFLSLLNDENTGEYGVCRILGEKTKLFPAGRDNSVLSGSGTLVNFHHTFQSGIMVSKEAIIRLHFLPLACELLVGRIAVIHSNNESIASLFATECCKRNIRALGSNFSDGILKSESRSPGTALFRFVDQVIEKTKIEIEEDREQYLISLYHFTNFGASPDIQIYSLPFEIYKFYKFTQQAKYKQEWNTFVSGYYSNADFKKAKYEERSNSFLFEDKNTASEIQENDFKYWRNLIYERLINNLTIVPHLLRRSRKHKLSLDIIKAYILYIRKMKRETFAKIDQMAEFILSSNSERGVIKAVRKLDGVNNSYLLRRFILKDIVAKYYDEGNSEAIVTIEDYADYLFPDTSSWQETRDVLLISIYQKLHERNLLLDIEAADDDELEENVEP